MFYSPELVGVVLGLVLLELSELLSDLVSAGLFEFRLAPDGDR